jgi:predicted glycoside hydrolase/deacetylase ChbG (UPF0249 family)
MVKPDIPTKRRIIMRKLIINADDCGFSPEIDKAIEQCIAANCISGVSVTAVGSSFSNAVGMLKDNDHKEVGAHLSLTGPNTNYDSYIAFARAYFSGKIRASDIHEDFKRQIEIILGEGLEVTHLDSHEHVHMIPGIFKITLECAEKFGIKYIRIPIEPFKAASQEFTVKDLCRSIVLKTVSAGAIPSFKKSNILSNDVFLGHFHSGRINTGILNYFLRNIQFNTAELAVHPSIQSDTFLTEYPWYKHSPRELETLINGEWRKMLEEQGVNLVTHSEVGE